MAPRRLHRDAGWAKSIYETNARIYQPILESGLKTAPSEARGISRILRQGGVSRSAEILDLSCGIGRHAVNLAKLGYRVVGVDPSDLFLDRARTLASEAGVATMTQFVRGSFSNVHSVLSDLGRTKFGGILSMDGSLGVTADSKDDLRVLTDLRQIASAKCRLVVEIFDRVAIAKNFQWTMIQEFPDDLVRIVRSLSKPGSEVYEGVWDFYRKGRGGSLRHLLTVCPRVKAYSVAELKDLGEAAGWRFGKAFSSLEELRPYKGEGYRAFLAFDQKG